MKGSYRIFAATTLLLFTTFVFSSAIDHKQKEDTCNNSFNYVNVDFDPKFPKLLTDLQELQEAHSPQREVFSVKSMYIYYINSTIPEQRFIACITPKSGSTKFKQLFYKILNKDYRGEWENFVWKLSNYSPLQLLGKKAVEQLLDDKNIPRYQIVRNPYMRAISMYEEKLTKQAAKFYKRTLGYPEDKNITFEQFVDILYEIYAKPSTNEFGYVNVDKHFQPQNRLCKKHLGMSYNYIMKIEEMDQWFECFVDKMAIWNEAMHGWGENDGCYLSTTKHSCNGPTLRNGVLLENRPKNKEYSTRMQQYYTNQTILRMVSEIFSEDFTSYNYPISYNLEKNY